MLPVKGALVIFFAIAVLGAIATLVTGNDPGSLLGNLIVLGAVIAALVIRRQRMYLLIPLPALTYLVLAILTGAIHDNGTDTSTTQLGLNFLQWIGNGFFSLCAGTILVLLIFGARLLASRQLVSGSFPMSEQRPAAGRSGRAASPDGRPDAPGGRTDPRRDDRRRTNRAPWDDPDPWYDQGPRDRDPWTDRDRREDRDSRGSRGSRDGRDGGDSRQAPRPDRRAGNRGGDDRDRDDRRPGPRNVPPGRGEPPTRALPPGRPGQDSRDDRGYRGGGGSRNGRDSRDSRDSRGRTSRGGRGSWDERDPRDR